MNLYIVTIFRLPRPKERKAHAYRYGVVADSNDAAIEKIRGAHDYEGSDIHAITSTLDEDGWCNASDHGYSIAGQLPEHIDRAVWAPAPVGG